MMTDIDDNTQGVKVGCYADDTRMLRGITSPEDQPTLQFQLNVIYKWADENRMFFNEKKFECLSVSTAARKPQYTTPNGNTIDVKPSVKDLGIYIQNELSFSQHISTIAAKGTRLAGWADRSFKYKKPKLMRTLLK